MNREYLSYDSSDAVDYYSQVYTGFWNEFPSYLVEDYVEQVKQAPESRGNVLCVGSGLGNEAEMLLGYGLTPVCFDGAWQMIHASSAKGLASVQGNFLSLPFRKDKFDGVWTYKTLNHALDMRQLEIGLMEISRVLKNRGGLSICMLKGKRNERSSSFLDGTSTRENLYLTEETFHKILENNNFLVESAANLRRGHTDYMIASAINFKSNR